MQENGGIMSKVEDEALKNVSFGERNETRAAAEKLIRHTTKPLVSTKNMEVFSTYAKDDANYREHRIAGDIAYTQKREAQFQQNYDVVAHAVEYMVSNWLDSNEIFDSDTDVKNPKAGRTSIYDDYTHGVDVSKTWILSDEDAKKCRTRKFTIAIDVTTSKNNKIIYDDQDGGASKLAQFPNNLPYGFTSIKYYAERDPSDKRVLMSIKKTCVPRFVIGLDRDIVSNMLRNNEVVGNLDENTPSIMLTRFKVLSEMRNQATLFLEKLPNEKDYDIQRSYLETILKHTEKPIINCAESMIPYPIKSGGMWAPTYEIKSEALPSSEIEKFKKTSPRGMDAVTAIEQLIEDENLSCYDATYAAIQNGARRFRKNNPEVCYPKEQSWGLRSKKQK